MEDSWGPIEAGKYLVDLFLIPARNVMSRLLEYIASIINLSLKLGSWAYPFFRIRGPYNLPSWNYFSSPLGFDLTLMLRWDKQQVQLTSLLGTDLAQWSTSQWVKQHTDEEWSGEVDYPAVCSQIHISERELGQPWCDVWAGKAHS